MPTLTIRDLPQRVWDRLRERAERHRRSPDREAARLIEEALDPPRADTALADAAEAHALFDGPLPDLIAEGKRAGRAG